MKRIALLFPGQGVDYRTIDPGLFSLEKTKPFAQAAEKASGIDVAGLCDPAGAFDADVAPLVIFTASLACAELIKEKADIAACAGFSLGEYAALCTAGVFSPEDGMKLVAKRTSLMNAASKKYPGSMTAILGLDDQVVEDICSKVTGTVSPVNYNCKGQLVIAGEPAAVEAAAAQCLAAGAMKAVPLPVAGAFHTPLMEEAADALKEFLCGIPSHKPAIPVYTNLTGGRLRDDTDWGEHLKLHMISPVQWKTLFGTMVSDGYELFGEAGPGTTLSGFARRISRDAKVMALGSVDTIAALTD